MRDNVSRPFLITWAKVRQAAPEECRKAREVDRCARVSEDDREEEEHEHQHEAEEEEGPGRKLARRRRRGVGAHTTQRRNCAVMNVRRSLRTIKKKRKKTREVEPGRRCDRRRRRGAGGREQSWQPRRKVTARRAAATPPPTPCRTERFWALGSPPRTPPRSK